MIHENNLMKKYLIVRSTIPDKKGPASIFCSRSRFFMKTMSHIEEKLSDQKIQVFEKKDSSFAPDQDLTLS